MAGECQGRRSPPAGAGAGAGWPASRLSLLVGLAESFSSSPAPAEGSSSRSPTARSPRSFDYEGAVGLGIVAAMNGGALDSQPAPAAIARTPRPVAPRRSQPIPIVSARPEASATRRKERRLAEEEEEEMELSESYTCVISHVGGTAVSKRVYMDDGAGDPWGCCPGVFYASPPPPRPALLPAAEDFLSRCFRCSKDLHGLDIFMYRGDKAFCSTECRCQQIISDEHRGNWLPDAHKTFDSPCSAPLLFAAGIAAA